MKEIENAYIHGFKCHVPNLLNETFINACRPKDLAALRIPLNIFQKYLKSVIKRSAQINDPVLNRLMIEMSLYEEGNPESPYYDEDVVERVKKEHLQYIKKNS